MAGHGGHGGHGGGGGGHGGEASAWGGGFVAPVFVEWSYGVPVEEEKYSIRATLGVYLSDQEVVFSPPGPMAWIAQWVSLKREAATLGPAEFLRQSRAFLESAGIKNVRTVGVGRERPFKADKESILADSDNLDDAFEESAKLMKTEDGLRDVSVVAHGYVYDFELQLALVLSATHRVTRPSVQLHVLALPAELRKNEGEEQLDYMDRINKLLDDSKFVRGLESSVRPKLERLLLVFREKLQAAFDVSNITQDVKIDIRRMIPI